VRAWAVLRPASVEGRFEALHASGMTEPTQVYGADGGYPGAARRHQPADVRLGRRDGSAGRA
jgi:hypothetical protein